MKIPAIFLMSVIFSIILPLLDIVSDWYLFYSTMNFKGESLTMAACRSCYNGIADSYKDNSSESTCDVCTSDMSHNDGGIICGVYPPALDKMAELLKDHSCLPNTTVWRMRLLGPKNATIEERDTCQLGDRCCITTPTKGKAKKDMNQNLPDSTNWANCKMYSFHGGCEYCAAIGASDVGTCAKLLLNDDAFVSNEISLCKDGYYTASESSKHFEQSNKGPTKHDECSMRIASNQSHTSLGHDTYFRCNDPCRLHINILSLSSETIYDWTSWSHQIEYMYGRLVGGKACSTNLTFGYCLLAPILLNWLFVLKVWSSDFKNKRTPSSTFIFAVTTTYPIWLVVRYLYHWRNEEQMKQQKERFEREVATLEGYLESILQVSNYLHITLHIKASLGLNYQYLITVCHLHLCIFFIIVPHIICPPYANVSAFSCRRSWISYLY